MQADCLDRTNAILTLKELFWCSVFFDISRIPVNQKHFLLQMDYV